MAKCGRHCLNQGIKVHIANNGRKQCQVPPEIRHEGGHNMSSVTVLTKCKT